ncbi:MAG: HIT family protein [Sedimentisphaerales bacterium]|nr:HIT family protein [Sedimentisphaerales bacterium]
MSQDCIFCMIVAGKLPCGTIYEDDDLLSFLDIGPISEGHALVVPKRHVETLSDCPADLMGRLAGVLGPLSRAVVQAVGAEGCNILLNNGRCAGQLVGHLHVHIIPRHPGDGVFTEWPAQSYPPGRMETLLAEIRSRLPR